MHGRGAISKRFSPKPPLNLFGQENDYSDDSEDDPFDKDEKARGRVRRGTNRERTKDSATSTC